MPHPRKTVRVDQLVGLVELAELTGLTRANLSVRRSRGLLPEPVAVVSGSPLWERDRFLAEFETPKAIGLGALVEGRS